MSITVKYLDNIEKQKTRELWEELFYEDSRAFIEYYYKEKCIDNQILALYDNENIVSMIHLNPYDILIRNSLYKSEYIVGVATKKQEQHKGYMDRLMLQTLKDCYKKKKAFCFLMPAIMGLYERYGFTYVFDEFQQAVNLAEYTMVDFINQKSFSIDDLANWIYEYREKRYELYIYVNNEYINRLIKELESEMGHIFLLYKDNKMCGIYMEWGIDKPEYRALYLDDDEVKVNDKQIKKTQAVNFGDNSNNLNNLNSLNNWNIDNRDSNENKDNNGNNENNSNKGNNNIVNKDNEENNGNKNNNKNIEKKDNNKNIENTGNRVKRDIMARITCLKEFIKPIHLCKESIYDELIVLLEVQDNVIRPQSGSYMWYINKHSSTIIKLSNNDEDIPMFYLEDKYIEIDIQQLTSWLFGYDNIENLIDDAPSWTSEIDVINSALIDEIV